MSYSVKLLLVVFCGIAFAETDFDKIERNAKFQVNFSNVGVMTQISGASNVEMGLAKTKEEKDCIRGIKTKAEETGLEMVSNTVGKVIPDIERLAKSGTEAEKQAYADNSNYPQHKKSSLKDLLNQLKTWIPQIQSNMAACRKM